MGCIHQAQPTTPYPGPPIACQAPHPPQQISELLIDDNWILRINNDCKSFPLLIHQTREFLRQCIWSIQFHGAHKY